VKEKLGRKAEDIAWVVATHFHIDHVGGVKRLMDLTPAKAMFHEAARAHIEGRERLVFPPLYRFPNMIVNKIDVPDPKPTGLDLKSMSRLGLPILNEPVPFQVEGYYKGGDDMPGENGFKIIETPGHTFCSVCFHNPETGALISGDTLLGGRYGPDVNTFVINRSQIAASARKLKGLKVSTLYPGHGYILTGESLLYGMAEDPMPDGIRGLYKRYKRHLEQKDEKQKFDYVRA
jgi:glyoxylase-like metal-dependent hydrolase (beta-lactamase superfamily II)